MTTSDSEFLLAFQYLLAMVKYYAPSEDFTVQAFLPRAEAMARELLQNAQSSTNGRESSGNSGCLT